MHLNEKTSREGEKEQEPANAGERLWRVPEKESATSSRSSGSYDGLSSEGHEPTCNETLGPRKGDGQGNGQICFI